MENNFENEKTNHKHSYKYLSIAAIALSVVSILFSSFTLINVRRPKNDFPMNKMHEMQPGQFENRAYFSQKPNDMPPDDFQNFNQRNNRPDSKQNRGFNGNRNFDNNKRFNNKNFGENKNFNKNKNFNGNDNNVNDNGPTVAPEITPPSGQ